jgi:glutamate/tyrosine decarboxylase-like PLP-dependent enzyme
MQPLFTGVARADSLTLDPHKWLNTPFEAGCILFRHWEDLSATFGLTPAYLQGAMGMEHNQYEYGFELSRTDRALKVWLALRQYGVEYYAHLVARHLALAKHLADLVSASDDFELVAEPELSICCFRFVPREMKARRLDEGAYLDTLNYDIEMALMEDGRALISGTELNGMRVLRACIASHSVSKESVEETLQLLREIGGRLHRVSHRAAIARVY